MSAQISSLEISNFQRISAVKIEPTDNIIGLYGKNANGKTSVLDAIETTLCKFDSRVTKRPVKDGAGRADIRIRLTDGTELHQKFIPSGPSLTGTGPDGKKIGQKDLDVVISQLGVDAASFILAGEKKQLETLLSVVDLPFVPAELDRNRKQVFDARADVGRQSKAIGDISVNDSLPVEETSASELIGAIQTAKEHARSVADATRSVDDSSVRIVVLSRQIAELSAELESQNAKHEQLLAHQESLTLPADTNELEDRLASVEETNAAVRANNAARTQAERKAALQKKYEALTKQLANIDQQKAEGLASAEMPIDGLSFDEEGVLFQGVPLSRASGAEQIIVSAAMIIATDPEVRTMVIRNGNVMDADSLAVLQEMCEDNDFQAFVEFVSDSEDHEFRLVDGELA